MARDGEAPPILTVDEKAGRVAGTYAKIAPSQCQTIALRVFSFAGQHRYRRRRQQGLLRAVVHRTVLRPRGVCMRASLRSVHRFFA